MWKILVADDDRVSRELIRDVLEAPDRLILEACHGQEAVEIAAETEPDLVLLDIQMPVLDGYGTLRELRRNPRFARLHVVAVTANAMEGERRTALSAGFDAYMAKPFNTAALRELVRQLLEGRR